MSQKNFDRLERGQNGAARIMCGDVAWVSGAAAKCTATTSKFTLAAGPSKNRLQVSDTGLPVTGDGST